MPNGIVTSDDVDSSLNLVERALSHLSPDDEYRAAMLHNQAMMTQAIYAMSGEEVKIEGGPFDVDLESLPRGLVGKSTESISTGGRGNAMFNVRGSTYYTRVKSESSVEPNETVVVSDEGNMVRPASGSDDAFKSLVGSGVTNIEDAINPALYRIYESDDLDYANDDGVIVLEPGDEIPIVSSGDSPAGVLLMAIGANDEPNVTYSIQIDGEGIVGGETSSPLGTVNSPFSFVDEFGGAIPASSRVDYVASYSDDASGQIELAGRLHAQEL